MTRKSLFALSLATTIAAFGSAGCGGAAGESGQGTGARVRTLTLGGYTTPREVYGREIIPAFQKYWKEKTGEEVRFEESYQGSGAQARAIIGGFEADVAALSLEPDIQKLVEAGLITHDWKAKPFGGMVSRSIVVIAVRPGNPKGIRDWDDLRRPDVQVLTPNPRSSGGAMWNIAAIYGAVTRGHAGRGASPETVLAEIVRNVPIMDKGARESILNFESGVGDAAITYENEVLVARQAGQQIDYVIPRSTILIENPVAVVDVYADKHGNRDLAEAFVAFLSTPEVQRMYARYGLRSVDEQVARETQDIYPPVTDLFTVRDLGDWPKVTATLFEPGALFDQVTTSLAKAR